MFNLLDLTLFLFTIFSACVEGILYAKLGAEAFKWDEHRILLLMRGSVGVVAIAAFILGRRHEGDIYYLVVHLIAWMFWFVLPHDEMYNFTRAKVNVNPIPYKWGYQSPTDTSIHHSNGRQRTMLFLIGMAILIGAPYVRRVIMWIF